MKNKVSQKEAAFYLLYTTYKEDPNEYVPTWAFGGEMRVPELNMWVLMTYKCPARISDIFRENPGLLQRRQITGRSGSRYYEYRIAPNPQGELIKEQQLYDFYKKVKNSRIVVKSSSDKTKEYALTPLKDGKFACTCPGYKYRKNCKHSEEARYPQEND